MTNREKIEEIFPNLEISPDPYSPSVDICVGGIMMMRVDRNWWNAEYKELTTKNNLEVDCISRKAVLNFPRLTIRNYFGEVMAEVVDVKDIRNLPSVTPQEPQSFKWCTDCKEYDQEKHCCHRCSRVIRDTVAEMKQAQESRWVPTTERLPNKNQWVLVTTEDYPKLFEIMCYQGIRIGRHDIGNGWEEYEYPSWTSGHGDIQSSHPKAWMPLPLPWKGE